MLQHHLEHDHNQIAKIPIHANILFFTDRVIEMFIIYLPVGTGAYQKIRKNS